jgi:hypothetical protein
MTNLFNKSADTENEEPKETREKTSDRGENTPETQELRQKEFVWTEYDTNSKKKSADWYFVLWTIAISGAVGAVLLENILFGLFIIIAAFSVTIYASRKPRLVDFRVSRTGIEVDTIHIPLSSLSHFYIAEDGEPTYLLLQSKKVLSTLYSFPVAHDVEIDSLHAFLATFLEEQAMEVPFSQRLMDRIGF